MGKKIPISQLRPGMYVEDVFNATGQLLCNVDALVNGYYQIESLKRQGASFVFIDLPKSGEVASLIDKVVDEDFSGDLADSPEIVIENADSVLLDYEKKMKQAYSMRQKTVHVIRNMLTDARAGRLVSIKSVVTTIEEMVEQILTDPDVYLRICQLKKHSFNTYIHSVNVSVLMAGFAASCGFSNDKIVEASIGGILHDIGKVKIPERLLRKNGAYTLQEMELIKQHPFSGLEILKKMSQKVSDSTLKIIAQHHERCNGGGYPQRLKGNQIDEMAMICALADVYDTLTSETTYRKSCLPQEALALIFQGSDEEYPRTLVEQFTKMLGIYPVGSFVKLVSGEMGVVVRVNRNSLLAPSIMLLFDTSGQRVAETSIRNLSNCTNENDSWRIECSLNPEHFQVDTDEYVISR